MSDDNATHKRRVTTMKEHLAGLKGAAKWHQEIVANHLEHLSSVYDQAKPKPVEPTIEEVQQSG